MTPPLFPACTVTTMHFRHRQTDRRTPTSRTELGFWFETIWQSRKIQKTIQRNYLRKLYNCTQVRQNNNVTSWEFPICSAQEFGFKSIIKHGESQVTGRVAYSQWDSIRGPRTWDGKATYGSGSSTMYGFLGSYESTQTVFRSVQLFLHNWLCPTQTDTQTTLRVTYVCSACRLCGLRG